MAAENWTYDAAIGIYKNNTLSNELLQTSVGACKVLPFSTPVPGFGKHMGETVNIMSINELPDPTSAQLQENVRIPIDKISYNNRALTLVEWGRGVEHTELMSMLGKFDIQNILQKALDRQMQRAMDTATARAFFSTTAVMISFIPTSATGGTFDTDGTPTTVATNNLTWDHIGVLADYLTGTIHVPPYQGEDYVGLSCRRTLRGLKSDNLWQAVQMYLRQGDLFYRGEMGKTENIRWVEVHREAAISNTAGTSTVLGEAVVFGDEAIARVEATPPHLRMSPNYKADFGRTSACAWYGVLQFGSWWATATDGQAKIVKITSA